MAQERGDRSPFNLLDLHQVMASRAPWIKRSNFRALHTSPLIPIVSSLNYLDYAMFRFLFPFSRIVSVSPEYFSYPPRAILSHSIS
jgi:hypothetical protein